MTRSKMAGGRSTRRKSKVTSGAAKRSLESSSDNAETKKGKSSGASVKGKKLKLQEEEEKQQRHLDNNQIDGNSLEDSLESKYVPPFSRSAKRLAEKQCAGSTERRGKSKPRQGRERKSQKIQKTGKDHVLSSGKEPLSPQQVRNVHIEVEANQTDNDSEGGWIEVVELESASGLETSSEELNMVGVRECMERLLELLACEPGSEHQDPNKVVVKDGMKPAADQAAKKAGCSLTEEVKTNLKTCGKDGGTTGKETLKQAALVGPESDISLTKCDAIPGDPIHELVESLSVADEGMAGALEVEENKTLTVLNDEKNIASKLNATAEADDMEKQVECHLLVEGSTKQFTEGLVELVSQQCDHSNITITNNNDINNNNNNNNIENRNHTNSSNSKGKQTDTSKSSNFNNNINKDRKMNNIANNNKTNGSERENEVFLGTDLREAGVGTHQETGEELYKGEGFELDMVTTKEYATVVDQQVPMLVAIRGNSTSMLTAEGKCQVSEDVKDSSGMEASFHLALQSMENNVLSQLSRSETAYLKTDSSAITKSQNIGTENCLSEVDLKDVVQEEKCPQNEQEQASMLVQCWVHAVKHAQSGSHRADVESLNMKEMELDCRPNQEPSVTATAQQTLSNTDNTSGIVNSSPEKHDGSTAQSEMMDHENEPADVAQQTSNNKSVTSDVDMKEKGTVECLLDVDCEMDCTDSQLVHLDDVSLKATVEDAAKENPHTSTTRFTESDQGGSGSREASAIATDVPKATEDETMEMCDMIKGLTRELSALNQYLMGAWKEVEAIKKQRQARLKSSKTKRAKQ